MLRRVDPVKRVLRRPAGAALATALRASDAQAGIAVCYHRVGDPQGPAGTLIPALGTRLFADQLRHLRARYRLVRAGELAEAIATRRRGQRFPLAVTFDDDLAAHAGETARLLRQLGMPATFFLGGNPGPFFWQALQAALDAGMPADDPLLPRVEDPTPHRLAAAIRVRPAPEREALTAALLERGRPDPELSEDGIRALVAAGFEIGFHTHDHELLDRLDDEALRRALSEGRERLEEIARAPLRTIAYPFGLADARVIGAARAAGYEAGFTLDARAITVAGDPLLMGRFQPSFETAGHTAMELSRGMLRALSARS